MKKIVLIAGSLAMLLINATSYASCSVVAGTKICIFDCANNEKGCFKISVGATRCTNKDNGGGIMVCHYK